MTFRSSGWYVLQLVATVMSRSWQYFPSYRGRKGGREKGKEGGRGREGGEEEGGEEGVSDEGKEGEGGRGRKRRKGREVEKEGGRKGGECKELENKVCGFWSPKLTESDHCHNNSCDYSVDTNFTQNLVAPIVGAYPFLLVRQKHTDYTHTGKQPHTHK